MDVAVRRVARAAAQAPVVVDEQRQVPLEAVLRSADDDREALADRLHDGPAQAVAAARLAAAGLPGGDAAMLREALDEALVGLRHTIWFLRSRDDVAVALGELAERTHPDVAGQPLLVVAGGGVPAAVALGTTPTAVRALVRLVQTGALVAPPARLEPVDGGVDLVVAHPRGPVADLAVRGALLRAAAGGLSVRSSRTATDDRHALRSPSPTPAPAAQEDLS